MKSRSVFIKCIFTNRLAQVFVAIHFLSLICFYVWAQHNPISTHNFYYQPFIVKTYIFANLPSILLSGLIFSPFYNTFSSLERTTLGSGIYFLILASCSSFQWALIGYAISKFINTNKIQLR